jgi:glycosyltransferase involved in cell wall biosynthesis
LINIVRNKPANRLPIMKRGYSSFFPRLSADENAYIKKWCKSFYPDVVMVNYVWLSGVFSVLENENQVLRLILTHDVLHQRSNDFAKLGLESEHDGWTFETESTALKKAQILIAIQKEDASLLKRMAPDSEVICVPKAAFISPIDNIQIPGRCLFVGSGADHNVIGIKWFLDQVWPEIVKEAPHASLHICGSVCDFLEDTRAQNLTLQGRVDDIKHEYNQAEICIIPTLIGSGLKIKLVEALSYGRAIISTSFGIQGVRDLEGQAVLVADTVDDFSKSVLLLINNPELRTQMEIRAKKFVKTNFSPEVCYQPLVDLIISRMSRINSLK